MVDGNVIVFNCGGRISTRRRSPFVKTFFCVFDEIINLSNLFLSRVAHKVIVDDNGIFVYCHGLTSTGRGFRGII